MWQQRGPGLALRALTLLALGACAFASTRGVSAAMQNGAAESRAWGTMDDLLLEVARRLPGFGGMFIDRDGRLAVYLLDPAEIGAAEEAIAAVFGRERFPPGARAVQGQYSFLQLNEWHGRLNSLFGVPGVVLTDLDEGRNRLAVGLERAGAGAAVERELSRLGIPREAVVIEETRPIIPLPGSLPAP